MNSRSKQERTSAPTLDLRLKSASVRRISGMSFSEANQINPVTAPDISFAIECLFGLEQPLREGPIPSSLCGSFRGVWRRSATNGLAVAASNSRLVGSSVAFQPVEQVSLNSQRPEREFPWIRHAILQRVKKPIMVTRMYPYDFNRPDTSPHQARHGDHPFNHLGRTIDPDLVDWPERASAHAGFFCVSKARMGSLNQWIDLVPQPRHFGGRQWYFECPVPYGPLSYGVAALGHNPGSTCRARTGSCRPIETARTSSPFRVRLVRRAMLISNGWVAGVRVGNAIEPGTIILFLRKPPERA